MRSDWPKLASHLNQVPFIVMEVMENYTTISGNILWLFHPGERTVTHDAFI